MSLFDRPILTMMRVMDAVLLCNLGSPNSPRASDVRMYLREFLMDAHVLQMPCAARWALVNLLILPFRPGRTAEAYESIWTPHGSPLIALTSALASALEDEIALPVAIGMRYGSPSIQSGLEALAKRGAKHVLLAPLYPQFADSTTTTCVERATIEAAKLELDLRMLAPFYSQASWLDAVATRIKPAIHKDTDCLLLSYHGLPEAHIKRADPSGQTCLARAHCCQAPGDAAATCYKHQCLLSSHEIAKRLGLAQDQYRISFQSRLGRAKWLLPATDHVLERLPAEGIKRITVACPGFTADNLETLEEIGIRGKEVFIGAGGESFTLVPCLNDDAQWVKALAQLCVESQSP